MGSSQKENDELSREWRRVRRSGLVGRRDYLRLAGAAGVAGVGVSTLAGQATANATLSRTLTIEGSGTRADYNFSVGGEVTKSTAMGAATSSEDTISGQDVSGAVGASGRDSYAFTEELTAFNTTGDPFLYLNGEPLTDTLVVEDINEGRTTNYEIRVDGEVLKSTAMASDINASDEITPRNDPDSVSKEIDGEALAGETYVFGGVYGGRDSYVVSGEITGFHADGDVNVYLNGELVEKPGQFIRNTLTFESTDGNRAEYEFSVSGDLAKSTWLGATINDNDTVDHGSATGFMTDGRDSYVFTGEIMEFTGDPNLRVFLNGEVIDAAALSREAQFENTLTIDGGGGRTEYRLIVEGDLAENYGLTQEDSINGKVADGAVGSGQESYTFSGDISKFEYSTDGAFTTILNGQEVDPETLGRTQTVPEAEDLPNSVAITGIGADRKEYGVSVTGMVSVDESEDTSTGDNPAGSFARGFVTSGTDEYRFTGQIESITDYETFQVDIDYGARRIDIESFDGTQTDYEILFSGDLDPTSSISNEDSISGGRATGAVADGTDTYEFTGEFFELTIQNQLTVEPTYKPHIDDIMVTNRDDIEHTFRLKAVDTSGSSEQTIMEEDITVASNEKTTYQTVFPVGKESRLDVTLDDSRSASRSATVVSESPLLYGLEVIATTEAMGVVPRHMDLGLNERRVF